MTKWMEPATPDEWQAIVDGAYAMLALERARGYGFLTFDGSLTINAARCEDILRRGKALGYHGRDAAIEIAVRGLCKDATALATALDIVLTVAHEARA